MKYEMTAIGAERLSNAIVEQAARDYMDIKKELMDLSVNPSGNDTDRIVMLEDELTALIKFFKSEWYRQLTTVDGVWLMKELDKKAVADWHKDQKKKEKKKA